MSHIRLGGITVDVLYIGAYGLNNRTYVLKNIRNIKCFSRMINLDFFFFYLVIYVYNSIIYGLNTNRFRKETFKSHSIYTVNYYTIHPHIILLYDALMRHYYSLEIRIKTFGDKSDGRPCKICFPSLESYLFIYITIVLYNIK